MCHAILPSVRPPAATGWFSDASVNARMVFKLLARSFDHTFSKSSIVRNMAAPLLFDAQDEAAERGQADRAASDSAAVFSRDAKWPGASDQPRGRGGRRGVVQPDHGTSSII